MADLYLKKLESERKTLWATCRLKGLAQGTPDDIVRHPRSITGQYLAVDGGASCC